MPAKLDGTNGLLQQYDYQTPTTGFSYTFAAGVNVLVMQPAGTLATGTITMPASPADGMTITFSSTQTITALTVNANTGQSIVGKPTSFGVGSAATFVYRLSNTTWYPTSAYANSAIPKSSLPTGTVLQVVQTTKTDSFSTTSTSYVTFITVSITPTSASSKVLVTFGANGGTAGDVAHGYLGMFRGATQLFKADAAGSRTGATSVINTGTQQQLYYGGTFLDSPATTSSTTYTIQVLSSNGQAIYLNRSGRDNNAPDYDGRSVSSITVMEIAA
jgi:hypothetical protein